MAVTNMLQSYKCLNSDFATYSGFLGSVSPREQMAHLVRSLATEAHNWMSIRSARDKEWIKLLDEDINSVVKKLEKIRDSTQLC